ncbi:VanW family protein [Oceanobacillus senegalensis]|uniref:VanW family protein n=1 Tax=Oceanobacillus senegalensis TaxID=1936063 RepID=UPI000A30B07C|nr:VanW family protein [Oceanobacillus senegalensis]
MFTVLLSLLFSISSIDTEVFQIEDDYKIKLEKVEIDQYYLSYFDQIFIDEQKLDLLMNDLEEELYQPPVNAKFDETNTIVPGKPGVTLDRNKFQIEFRKRFYNHSSKKLRVPVTGVYPKVDSGLLKEISTRQLGSYATFFRQSNKERSNNIELAAEAIDNTVIFPGERFSFNEVVGERTKEKGYKQAPVIVKGELAEDIGGGICQVSSTLFNAVDLQGIQIIERYAHSRNVPYVPSGRDATVSWWGPDFVFKNLYNEPILIRARAEHGKMIVQIYTAETAEHFTGN